MSDEVNEKMLMFAAAAAATERDAGIAKRDIFSSHLVSVIEPTQSHIRAGLVVRMRIKHSEKRKTSKSCQLVID
jgi:hypothetical protein